MIVAHIALRHPLSEIRKATVSSRVRFESIYRAEMVLYLNVLNVLNIAVIKHTHTHTSALVYWVAYGCLLLRRECSGCAANGFLINTQRGYCFKLKRNRSADCKRVAYWIALEFYFIFNEWAEEYHSHYHLFLVPFFVLSPDAAYLLYGTQRTVFFI